MDLPFPWEWPEQDEADVPPDAAARPRRRAFTLFELLAVISVLAVAAALAAPALARARAQARAAACLLTARQAALEWTAGVEEHRQRRTLKPGEYAPSRCAATGRWHDRLVSADAALLRRRLQRPMPVVWDQAVYAHVASTSFSTSPTPPTAPAPPARPHPGGFTVAFSDGSARCTPAVVADDTEPAAWP